MNKEKQKQILIDIMEADSKDGLYRQQTAVKWLIEQLQAPCRGIPSHIIEQAKQMEKERDKKIAIHFMVLGIKNKGDYSKIDFYKEIEKL